MDIAPDLAQVDAKYSLMPDDHRRTAVATILATLLSFPFFLNYTNLTFPFIRLFTWHAPLRTPLAKGDLVFAPTLHFTGPLVLLGALLVLLWLAWRKRLDLGGMDGALVLVLVAAFTLSIVIGQLRHGQDLSVLFYLQATIPLIAFFLGATLRASDRLSALDGLLVAIASTTLIVAAYAWSVRVQSGNRVVSLRNLEIAVPQFRNYFPAVVTIGLSIALARIRNRPVTASLMLMSTALFVPFMWSRTAMGMFFLVGAAHSVTLFRSATRRHSTNREVTAAVAGIAAAGLVFLGVALLPETQVGQRLAAQALSASPYDLKRAELAREGTKALVRSPIVGQTFELQWETTPGGHEFGFLRPFNPHNQYLDYGLKGGSVALFAFLLLLARCLRRSVPGDTSNSLDPGLQRAALAVVVAFSVGNLFQLYFTQPYSGSLLWLVLGLSTPLSNRASGTLS